MPVTWRAKLFAVFLCILWGGSIPSLKLTLEGMPPLAVAAWRFLIGVILIGAWCRLIGIDLKLPLREHRSLSVLGVIFIAQIVAINFGTNMTTSSYAVVLLNSSPLFTAVLAHLFIADDRLTIRKSVGLVLAFAGLSYMFIRTPPGKSLLAGNALALLSGVLLAVIFVYSKHLLRRLSPFQVLFWEMSYGVPAFFLLTWIFEGGEPYALTHLVIGGLLYQGIVVAAFCFVSWTHLLQRYTPSQVVSFQFSVPVFGLILSALLLGELVTLRFVLGVTLVAAGIYLVTTKRFEPTLPEL